MRRTKLLLLLCLLGLLTPTRASITQPDDIDTLLNSMTLEHKVGQMFMVNLYGAWLTDAGRDMLQTWQPGAVVLFDSNTDQSADQVTRLVNSYQQTITDAGGVPLFVSTDQEGGVIARLQAGFTQWPVPMLLTAANSPELAYQVGRGMAAELRAVGVNMNLAPVADLQTNLANPIIGRRSPGSDPEQVGVMLSQLIRGMQDNGVMATAKHFPGHGDTNEDSHTTLPTVTANRDRLDAVELVPFNRTIRAGVGTIMVAHLWYPAFDPDAPLPASLSYNIVSGLLRDELGYAGIIMTDALDMDAIDTRYSPEQTAVLAIQAGQDLIAIGANAGEGIQARAMQAVVDAVRNGEIEEARIDASVRRILIAKQRFGVLDWSLLEPAQTEARMPVAANTTLIETVFQAGISLVKDDADLVPLDDTSSVGVIFPGTRYGIQRECGVYSENIRWLAISAGPTDVELATALEMARQVDMLVIFTQDAFTNRLLADFVAALPTEKTVVVALASPYDMLRFPDISTYITTYSPLEPAIPTACALLFGMLQPHGTLSVDLSLPLPPG